MRLFKWAFLLFVITTAATYAQESVSLTRIGRGSIQSVQWHPDGDYILVATVTGAWLYTPDLQDLAHLPDAHLATLSPDGRYIAGVDDTHDVRLWDAATFEEVEGLIRDSFQRVRALAWSPDGKYLAVSGDRDEALLYVWNIETQDTVITSRITGNVLLWSPDGKYLAVSYQNGWVSVWGVDPPAFLNTLMVPASTMVWQNEENLLVLSYGDNVEATRWNVLTGEQVGNLSFPPTLALYNHEGNTLAIGGPSRLRLRDAETNEVYLDVEIDADYFETYMLAWSHDDRLLAAGTYNFSRAQPAEVLLIDPQTGEIEQRLGGARRSIQQLAWSRDDRYLLAVDDRQQIFIYDPTSGDTLAYSDAHTLVGDTLAWNSDGTQLAVADSLDSITLWDAQQVQQRRVLPDNGYPITLMRWQPSGDLIAAQARDVGGARLGYPLTFQVWDTQSGDNIIDRLAFVPDQIVDFFDWHPDGELIAVWTDESLHFWNAVTGDHTTAPPNINSVSTLLDINWSPSGRYLAMPMTGDGGGGSYVYDVETQAYKTAFAGLSYGTALWSPDDVVVALTWGTWGHGTPPTFMLPFLSRSAAPHLEDTESARFSLMGLISNTQQGFLSPNGSYAAAVDGSGSGMVWDARTGAPVTMLSDTAQVVWSPDETRLIVQRLDGSIWLLEADGSILEPFPISASMQESVGTFFWSPDSRQLAHLHDGVIDLWRLNE